MVVLDLYYRYYSAFLIFCWTIVLDMTFGKCSYMHMTGVLKIDLIGGLDRIIYQVSSFCVQD
jgi:hypothetical protein